MAYTTANLLTSINLRSFAPTDQSTFNNANILQLADEESQTMIVPEIMSVREEFFVTFSDLAITANKSAYDIPVRSVGLAAREVKILQSSGGFQDLPQIDPGIIDTTLTGSPAYFYVRDNQIILYPTPNATTGMLRIWFSKRPSALVETSSGGLITAFDTVANSVTVASIPSAWVTGNTFDLIRQDGGQENIAIDLVSVGVSGNTVTLPSLPSNLRVGDYIALADTSPLVQMPPEYRAVLGQAVCVRLLMSQRLAGADEENKRLEMMITQARKLINPRVVGESKKIVSRSW